MSVGGFQSFPVVRNTYNWQVDSITLGPDGDLWFLCVNQPNGGGWIGKVDPAGVVSVVTDLIVPGLPNWSPFRINTADASTLWLLFDGFPTLGVGGAAQLTLTGEIQYWPDSEVAATGPTTVTPDGSLWFTNFQWAGQPNDLHSIGRVDMAGAFDWYLGPQITIHDMTTGPDGGVWFTMRDQIGHISPSGSVEYHPIPPVNLPQYYSASSITTGPDHNLWITFGVGLPGAQASTQIARMTQQGAFTFFPIPPAQSPAVDVFPYHRLVTGSDGSLWYAMDDQHGVLGNSTTSGHVSVHDAGPSFPMFAEALSVGHDIFLRPWHSPGLAKFWLPRSDGGLGQEIANWMQIMWTVALLHHGGPPPPPLDTESVMGRDQLMRTREAAKHILELTNQALHD